MRGFRLIGLALLGGLALGGCSEDPTAPVATPVVTHTVDASTDWAFVKLAETPVTVSVSDPMASTAWDLGFQRSGVRVNSGVGGGGSVAVYCVCQNAGVTPEEVQELTAESELGDFMAVTADDIPAESAWRTADTSEGGVFDVDGAGWYMYNLTGQHQIWPTFQVYLVRTGSEVYKVQLINYYGPAGKTRQITFRSSRISG